MGLLNEIVNVNISKDTQTVSQAGFGTILILGPNLNVNSRVQFYTDLPSLALALNGGTDAAEYKAAAIALSMTPRVVQIAIGYRRGTKKLAFGSGTYTAGSIVSIINGTTITTAFTSTKADTLTAHAAAIQAGVADVLSAVYSAGDITLTPATGEVLAVSVNLTGITGTATCVITSTATEDVDDSMNAIVLENNNWYAVVLASHTEADVLLMASWVEANKKIFACSSDTANIADVSDSSDTTTILAQLKALAYDRTSFLYHPDADTTYPEIGILGRILPMNPGEYTAMYQTTPGVAVVSMTTTQSTNVRDKNGNTYQAIAGVNTFLEGKMVSGEYIDVTIFIDWLEAEIQTNVFKKMKSGGKKVAYTSAGILIIKNAMEPALKLGQNRNGISPTEFDENGAQIGGYYIVTPSLSSVSAADKAARRLREVRFTAFLAGAIHKVQIDGVVTL